MDKNKLITRTFTKTIISFDLFKLDGETLQVEKVAEDVFCEMPGNKTVEEATTKISKDYPGCVVKVRTCSVERKCYALETKIFLKYAHAIEAPGDSMVEEPVEADQTEEA